MAKHLWGGPRRSVICCDRARVAGSTPVVGGDGRARGPLQPDRVHYSQTGRLFSPALYSAPAQ